MPGMSALLCLGLIFVLAIVVITIFALASNRRKDSQSPKDRSARQTNKGSRSWIAYLVIAIILSFWSGLAAVFFLMVMWVILQNPKGGLSSAVSKTEQSTARRVYTWLFFSSFITVPVFIIIVASSYSRDSTNHEHVLHALTPLIFHAPLLLGLTSRSRFVYRHTQMGLMLISLRAGMAALALSMGDYPEDGIWLFLLGNGSLWLFGSIWGWVQVSRGDCWWMKVKSEHIHISSDEIESLAPQKHIERSREFVNRYDANNAKKHALAAFRRGDVDVKREAVKILEVLDEVESF